MGNEKLKENLSLAFTLIGIVLLTFYPLLIIGPTDLIPIFLIFSAIYCD